MTKETKHTAYTLDPLICNDYYIKWLEEKIRRLRLGAVIAPKGTLGCDCPFTDHCIYQKDKCEAPTEYGCGYKQSNTL